MKRRIISDIESFKQDGVDVRAVILDGAGECKKARRLMRDDAVFSSVILIWCNAHIFNLLFGDLFHQSNCPVPWPRETIDIVIATINYFNNHRVALGLLRERQIQDESIKKVVSLWNPGATRWNSYFDSCKILMRCKEPVRDTVTKDRLKLLENARSQDDKRKRLQLIDKVEVTYFWNNLEDIIKVMTPSCVCVDRVQSSLATMGCSLLSLLYCFSHFKQRNDALGTYMMECLETRWHILRN
jgi:hypothetical protein